MRETANYKLHLTDDSSERFQDWRNAMNGPDNSNMVKIDEALGEKAERSIELSAVLVSNAWVGETAPFVQELNIEGLSAKQNGTIFVSYSATQEQIKDARKANLRVSGQNDGKLIIVADKWQPTQDIPVSIILFG